MGTMRDGRAGAVRPASPTTAGRRRETREQLLDAGVELFEQASCELLRGFTAGAVADAAGFHRQTFYRHWDTQAAYVADLVRHVLSPDASAAYAGTVLGRQRRIPSPEAFVRDLAHHQGGRIAEEPRLSMRVALGMMGVFADPEFVGDARRYLDAVLDGLTAAFDTLLEAWGRRLCDDVSTRDLVRAVQAMIVGLAVQDRYGVDRWSSVDLLERSFTTLIEGWTVPVDAPGAVGDPVARR